MKNDHIFKKITQIFKFELDIFAQLTVVLQWAVSHFSGTFLRKFWGTNAVNEIFVQLFSHDLIVVFALLLLNMINIQLGPR